MIPREILRNLRQTELGAARLVRSLSDSMASFSLAPGFSPVSGGRWVFNRFSGFLAARKPLKRLKCRCSALTGLKPGANGRLQAGATKRS